MGEKWETSEKEANLYGGTGVHLLEKQSWKKKKILIGLRLQKGALLPKLLSLPLWVTPAPPATRRWPNASVFRITLWNDCDIEIDEIHLRGG